MTSAQQMHAAGQPQLIALELDPPPPPFAVFRVDIERVDIETVFVLARTEEAAKTYAAELEVEDIELDWVTKSTHFLAAADTTTPNENLVIWVNGDDYVIAKDLPAYLARLEAETEALLEEESQ